MNEVSAFVAWLDTLSEEDQATFIADVFSTIEKEPVMQAQDFSNYLLHIREDSHRIFFKLLQLEATQNKHIEKIIRNTWIAWLHKTDAL